MVGTTLITALRAEAGRSCEFQAKPVYILLIHSKTCLKKKSKKSRDGGEGELTEEETKLRALKNQV